MSKMDDIEAVVLKRWHLVIAVAASLVIPSITATAAFYQFQLTQAAKDTQTVERIAKLELNNQKAFAEKSDLSRLEDEMRSLHDDVLKIKTLLQRR